MQGPHIYCRGDPSQSVKYSCGVSHVPPKPMCTENLLPIAMKLISKFLKQSPHMPKDSLLHARGINLFDIKVVLQK